MSLRKEEIKEFREEYDKILSQYTKVLENYLPLKLKNAEAVEYKNQGFLRRIAIMRRCINNIYDIWPLEMNQPLSDNKAYDLYINLQSFMFNTFGCLDNLAWIWVKERNLVIEPNWVGLRETNVTVRKTFSQDFQNYLSQLTKWFGYLENFRHALAHRIPLYVPPSELNEDEAVIYSALSEKRNEAINKLQFDEANQLFDKIKILGKRVPLMTHSFEEKSRPIYFHGQILVDWKTVISISEKFLKELEYQSA